MKLTAEELDRISTRLCNLASECHFMYDSAKLGSYLVACCDNSSFMVVNHLENVLLRADRLLDDLHCIEAILDGLLVQHKVLDDAEMI